jgi:energy-coupling factor transporter ATP-binding protein EcfA2
MAEPGLTVLLLGAPGSGKSTLARQALQAEGSGLIALAPGMDEAASYRQLAGNELYRVRGFDDPEFYPAAGSMKATGYDELLAWLRGVYASLRAAAEKNEPLPYRVLVTDTFNAMSTLAMNKTFVHIGVTEPPPAMSPNGAAFWGYQRQLQEALMRACRAIRGMGLHWIATCHIAEKELKETAVANPDQMEGKKASGMVPAISGGFRDVLAAGFDLVLHTGVVRPDATKPPVHYLQWQPSSKRPTKSRYGALADSGRIAADWRKLRERIAAADAAEAAK